jgi:hypothetical protein
MRFLVPILVAAFLLSGCIEDASLPDSENVPTSEVSLEPVQLTEKYEGTVLSFNTPVLLLSPDQLGDVERWFWVHENTTRLALELEADDELYMYVLGPGCHDWDCAHELATDGGQANITFDDPTVGGWEVVFFKQQEGAGEIDYTLQVIKDQKLDLPIEHEEYPGTFVGAHGVAFWISPDQLGDVFREFWVPDGTTEMTINVTSDPEMQFVLGQSNPSRDGSSEEYYPTENGRVDIHIEDPHIGGWYFIAFPPEEPGVHEVEYFVEITKHKQ